ncbi:hypothetical protein LOTGIDRAFT_163256 [Lottia gigantea]|uniref:Uncharacterized protein n=1 Tax=Lottia gigantea TaxID=225164 RepID=V4BSI0_LOTGI|nr:hypothetical protein LOTGIDRAFT_163256 [Lottia gigantea]ESO91894.1 hypothetical protein LOTGIDRAFT_163256 [Lottia gigantea]
MFFQPIPAKDKITFTSKEGKKETGNKIRFRNGFCHDVLTSVEIQEIVKAGGRIIRILDGIVYEENFKTPSYRDYILILRDLRNKYKREGMETQDSESLHEGAVNSNSSSSELKLHTENFEKVLKSMSKDIQYSMLTDDGYDHIFDLYKKWLEVLESGVVGDQNDLSSRPYENSDTRSQTEEIENTQLSELFKHDIEDGHIFPLYDALNLDLPIPMEQNDPTTTTADEEVHLQDVTVQDVDMGNYSSDTDEIEILTMNNERFTGGQDC